MYSWNYFRRFECCNIFLYIHFTELFQKHLNVRIPCSLYASTIPLYKWRENDILYYVNSDAFKNFNQSLWTFEDSVEGAYNFNGSRYVSSKSDMDHAANHEAESDPHFTVNSNDTRYVAIDSVKSIIP